MQRDRRANFTAPGHSTVFNGMATPSIPPGWVVAVVLAGLLLIVYGWTLSAPLIFDDDASLVRNPSIRSLWPLVGTSDQPGPLRPVAELPTAGRPLVNFTFAVNYCFGGLDPYWYHVFNLSIHFLS